MEEKVEKEEKYREMYKNFSEVTLDGEIICFECPHCKGFIQVEKTALHCRVFRHGYFYRKDEKGNIFLLEQINPHMPKEQCDRLVSENKIVGCSKPFQIVSEGEKMIAKICDYI
jgi:hypothetical protein